MGFKMNKRPIIQGTSDHRSALTAKQELDSSLKAMGASPMDGNAFGLAMQKAGGDYEKAKEMLKNDAMANMNSPADAMDSPNKVMLSNAAKKALYKKLAKERAKKAGKKAAKASKGDGAIDSPADAMDSPADAMESPNKVISLVGKEILKKEVKKKAKKEVKKNVKKKVKETAKKTTKKTAEKTTKKTAKKTTKETAKKTTKKTTPKKTTKKTTTKKTTTKKTTPDVKSKGKILSKKNIIKGGLITATGTAIYQAGRSGAKTNQEIKQNVDGSGSKGSGGKSNPYAKAKKKDPNLDSYIRERKKHKKGSPEYNRIQNKINEAYGVSKRHPVGKTSTTTTTVTSKQPSKADIKKTKIQSKADKRISEIDENVARRTTKKAYKTAKKSGTAQEAADAKVKMLEAKLADVTGSGGGRKRVLFGKLSAKNIQKKLDKARKKAGITE